MAGTMSMRSMIMKTFTDACAFVPPYGIVMAGAGPLALVALAFMTLQAHKCIHQQ